MDVTPAIKLTPTSSTVKLESHGGVRGRGFLYVVTSGVAINPSAKVRKDGSYNGNNPRLVLKANPALGVAADTVLDTLSVAANNWEILTAATPAPTDNGVFEVIVDCDGTAGNAFVDTIGV